jgi:catechol 2,3-dioxygenase-like lactoylglutathione lyase family enzyme
MIEKLHIVLYVGDQRRSTDFYKNVLEIEPSLDVPGMTEFELLNGTIIGLMPEEGIKRLLGEKIEIPRKADNAPRAELYLIADDPQKYFEKALLYGGRELSRLQPRDWGDETAYCSDPDGYIIAFAKKIEST